MIPIFIITCDRLECLKQSIQSYRDCIKTPFEIVICDQGTTYVPTIKFLAGLEFGGTIVYRWKGNSNIGRTKNMLRNDTMIRESIQSYFKSHPTTNYVVTDPDILLDTVAGDILQLYSYLLEKMSNITTVGPMLRIDDIPDYYPYKEQLLSGKKGLHNHFHSLKTYITQYEGKDTRFVYAPIHTTFGMHRQNTQWLFMSSRAIRTFAPYSAKHLDWYVNPSKLTRDQEYYMKHAAANAHWSKW